MAIPSTLVGSKVAPVVHDVDERWTMAYAAALRDHRPQYFDTERAGGIVAHPLFVVCPEWPVIVSTREYSERLGVPHEEVLTSVHATHDTTIHRLIRPGDRLTTTLETVGLEQKRPGTRSWTRLVTTDQRGELVASTTQAGIYLGVPLDGSDIPDPDPPPALPDAPRDAAPIEVEVPVLAGDAHTYTECARIWNPIHTSPAVAHKAGLPDIILHGTANLAHGVSAVVAHLVDGQPERIRRIACRFSAMVRLPSTLTIQMWAPAPIDEGAAIVAFEVRNGDGEAAVSDGKILFDLDL